LGGGVFGGVLLILGYFIMSSNDDNHLYLIVTNISVIDNDDAQLMKPNVDTPDRTNYSKNDMVFVGNVFFEKEETKHYIDLYYLLDESIDNYLNNLKNSEEKKLKELFEKNKLNKRFVSELNKVEENIKIFRKEFRDIYFIPENYYETFMCFIEYIKAFKKIFNKPYKTVEVEGIIFDLYQCYEVHLSNVSIILYSHIMKYYDVDVDDNIERQKPYDKYSLLQKLLFYVFKIIYIGKHKSFLSNVQKIMEAQYNIKKKTLIDYPMIKILCVHFGGINWWILVLNIKQ
jgi:hypothetical protein